MLLRSLIEPIVFVTVAAILALGGGAFGLWQMADHLVFRSIYLPEAPIPNAGIRLIDIEYPDELRNEGRPEGFRRTLGNVLTEIAALPAPPRTVLIDIWLSSNPAGEDAVLKGIEALHRRSAKVYAAVNPVVRFGADPSSFMQSHNAAIYFHAVDGYGHTQLGYAFGVLKYARELTFPPLGDNAAAGEMRLTALPVLAAIEPEQVHRRPASMVIPLGEDGVFERQTHHVSEATGKIEPAFPATPAATHVIIGSFAEDSNNSLKRPGTLLVAWALSDLLNKDSVAREPLNHPAALLGLAAFAVLIALGLSALGFRKFRVRFVPSRWSALAAGVAVAAFLLAVGALLALGAVMLLVGRVIPVAFPTACAALACIFALHRSLRWIANERVQLALDELSREKHPVAHDVFISYAHEDPKNISWVKANVVEPLNALAHPDGRPYKVFFDEKSIPAGEDWKKTFELAILGTRCFVPIYSESYFKRGYCLYEIELAHRRYINRLLRIVPLARVVKDMPQVYQEMLPQYIDVSANPDFLQELIAKVTVQENEGSASSIGKD